MTKKIAVITALMTTGGGDRLLESICSRFVNKGDKCIIYVLYPSKENEAFREMGITINAPPYILSPLLKLLGQPTARRIIDRFFHALLLYKVNRDNKRGAFTHVSMYHYSTYPLVTKLKRFLKVPIYYTEISSPKGRTFPSTINEFDEVIVPSVTIGEELVKYENLTNGYIPIPFFVDIKEKPPLPPHPHLPNPPSARSRGSRPKRIWNS